MTQSKTLVQMRRNQLSRTNDLWDGVTNPHGYDISADQVRRWYSLGKKCRLCSGPVLNQTQKLICHGCRAGGTHAPQGEEELESETGYPMRDSDW